MAPGGVLFSVASFHRGEGGTWSLGKLPRPCHTGISRLDTSALVVETVWVYGARCGWGSTRLVRATPGRGKSAAIETVRPPGPSEASVALVNDIVCHQEPTDRPLWLGGAPHTPRWPSDVTLAQRWNWGYFHTRYRRGGGARIYPCPPCDEGPRVTCRSNSGSGYVGVFAAG